MNFKQMILVDHLLNNIFGSWDRPNSKLIFELDGKIFTGNFTPKNDNGEPVSYYPHQNFVMFDTKRIFSSEASASLRSALLEHVFGESLENADNYFKYYIQNLKHLVLNDVIEVISQVDTDDYFPDEIIIPEILLDLENVETGKKFDYYIATNKKFNPVSFIDLQENNVD